MARPALLPCRPAPLPGRAGGRRRRLLTAASARHWGGLAATAGALNPLDVLLIGGQDCLQLRLEGVRLHFGVYNYHRALVLKCSCIDAVLERKQNRVDDESIQM